MTTGPGLVIVTPVYEDVEASRRLFSELADAFRDQLQVIAVDDGSVRSFHDDPLGPDAVLDKDLVLHGAVV